MFLEMGILTLRFMCSILMDCVAEIHEKSFTIVFMCIHKKQVLKFSKFLMNPLVAKVDPG